MSWIDIVFIVIVAVCALIGIGKGTYKSLVSLFGNIFALVIAFFLTKTITLALLEIEVINNLVFKTIYDWIAGWSGSLMNPDTFYYSIIEPFIAAVANTNGAITEAQGVALNLSYMIACLAVFIVLFIILRIVAAIIFKIIGSLINRESPGFPSRILGLVIGAVKGALYVVVLTLIFSFSVGFEFLSPVVDELENSTIAIHVYEGVDTIRNKIFADEEGETINRLIELSGIEYDAGSETPEE